ncbi:MULTISPECIES: GDP-mannose 4,6-dehydratase [Nocardiaceae]|uniref:GDP-mannose 4,6-dehydratase n=1 Tax=Rhodococcoides kroppenstedtii TaxID=293050 RepID=A0ABS7NW15_9NOCA|nr:MULTISPECIES: GDP-mannose 4,6-dehydratase [Rhodococcus]AMY20485.1 GDP-mannose 4,6-dehydratase [Rhodococcus sp. PBTS 1]MBY6314321.1 GDP-mannose 4,6-dehydratase [Rhodococcus kroppenstedtii]MBY6322220.1 GDP-mannose 4,6-dehydratase [Rhodococcus kroppenstedtii]MBY6401031.1 GDP-mannose 4,6-dehydratase [Rhodococcus kroppenstedtii]
MSIDGPSSSPVALITGVAGQDGTYLSELLVAKGWRVHGVARRDPSETDAGQYLSGVTLHVQDVADTDATADLISQVEPDHVFHLAGISSVWKSWQDPVLTTRVNGLSVVGVLEGCVRLQDRVGKQVTVVNASSAEIFAGSGVSPQNEDTPIAPTSPYGASKAFAHHMVQVYRAKGLAASNAILYNHESPRRPDTFVTRKITKAVAAIAAGEQDRLELGDTSAVRDWGWAPEYVDAMYAMAIADHGDDFVVATGEAHSVEAFLAAAFGAIGLSDWEPFVKRQQSLTRPEPTLAQRGDSTYIMRVLGWQASSTMGTVLSRLLDYDRRHDAGGTDTVEPAPT